MGRAADWLREHSWALGLVAAAVLLFGLLAALIPPRVVPMPISATSSPGPFATLDAFTAQRREMVRTQLRARGISDEVVLKAMEKVPRHLFVPEQYQAEAYADHPLPIGEGQTISQPYVVALMTELLALEPSDRVLEIGTGSGYQAAVLAEIANEVYTVEIIESLGRTAASRLQTLGYRNIRTRLGDGYYGWEENAPYDAIIVTAAPDHIPQPLIRQLKDGGRLVIPVGPPGAVQTLWRVEKYGDQVISHNEGEVRFVPLVRP